MTILRLISATQKNWITGKKLGITMKKFGMEMQKYIAINKISGIVNKSKKVNGKVVQVWSGIKIIFEEDEVEELIQ